jgi:HD-GYP domain-containing protein (c-di-GMP phosphodiesterase class II)
MSLADLTASHSTAAGTTQMPSHNYTLKDFVHRVLALRLLACAAAIALAFAAIAYVRGLDRISDDVMVTARYGIERIRVAVRRLLDTPTADLGAALQQALSTETGQPPDRRYGEYVYVRFTDMAGATLAKHIHAPGADPEALERALAAHPRGPDEVWQRRLDIGDHVYAHVGMPVLDRQQRKILHAEGLFRVSEDALTEVRRNAVRTALYAALVVLATALLLYPVVIVLMRRLAQFSEELLASNLQAMEALGGAIAKRDSDTDAHNYRVTLYALRLAESLDLEPDRLRALVKGAFLHDIGKIGIPDRILHKPGRLDEEEFDIMRTHVDHGIDIVERITWLRDAQAVVGGHHEKYDGSGYPQQASGESIALEARIFAIADVFDALTSRRPYKEPLSLEATLEILQAGRGKHFDPQLLDRFSQIAADLYRRYGGRDDPALRAETRGAVNRLFVSGLATLRY